jgi:phosphate starvation-inducible protein PhoH and related proteins
MRTPRLTKRQKRILKINNKEETVSTQKTKSVMSIREISPLTDNQNKAFESFASGKNLVLYGSAGTGKSFLALYLALDDLETGTSDYKKIILIRSTVPSRDMGFLPGNTKEKAKVYERPYYGICDKLYGRGDAYEVLKNKGTIEFMTTSFVRGDTLEDSIIIVDEFQNMDFGELCSVITRVGENSMIIMCGDYAQSDFRGKEISSREDILDFMRIINTMKSDFDIVEFGVDDIVRSGLVKRFLIALHNHSY